MIYILYNELANNGKGAEGADKAVALYDGKDITRVNVIGLDVNDFVGKLTADDTVVLCGGDGTLNHFVNAVEGLNIPCDVVLHAAGTGNDFVRDLRENYDEQDEVINLSRFMTDLPTAKINDIECKILNGVGFGIDGMCCEYADKMKAEGAEKINYAGLAIRLMLFKYKCPSAEIIVDGVSHSYKKVWLASAMNGRYYGGGMKEAPEQDRLGDKLTCVVWHDKGKIPTLINFPKIFEGKHVKNKKLVDVFEGNEITVKFGSPMALQYDGETVLNVTEYTMRK